MLLVEGAIAALMMGLSLGLLGGGGSILAVPILTFVFGLAPKTAIATSLIVVGVTSLATALLYARRGYVVWRTGLTFAAFAIVGSFIGGDLARYIRGEWLLILFALMMLVTGAMMLRPRKGENDLCDESHESDPLPIRRIAIQGTLIGFVTGLVGAGGGFLVVPALVLLGHLCMRKAIATSLFVIAFNSLAGFAGYMTHTAPDWPAVATLGTAALTGAALATLLAPYVKATTLRSAFGVFVLVMGVIMLYRSTAPTAPATEAITSPAQHGDSATTTTPTAQHATTKPAPTPTPTPNANADAPATEHICMASSCERRRK